VTRPAGVTFALTERWVAVLRALTRELGARLVLGLNLEAASGPVAAAEARALLAGLGSGAVEAFELGNEPSLYGIFPWYRTRSGRGVTGRPGGYGFTDFVREFTSIAAQLPAHALAGPSIGGPGWIPDLGRFLAAEPSVKIATVHRYPLQLCLTSPRSSRYPTVANLLATSASRGLADLFAPAVAAAHSRGLPLLVDELNTVACGAAPAVSQTFAAALWAPDALFELKRAGVDGVEMHTFPGAGYELFRLHRAGTGWAAAVAPEYYGLLLFAAAAPAGARLLPVSGSSPEVVRTWATLGRDGRVRVLVIDKDPSRAVTVRLRLPATAPAGVERLEAPSVRARAGVTLGGRTYGASTMTGALAPPVEPAVHASGGTYTVTVPAGTAALVSVPTAGAPHHSGFSQR
jgi:hypothetical protein